jgi:CheY-like chemotaxis protein
VVQPCASKIVLAADDNPANLRVLKAVIESQGYTFFGAASGSECLEMVERLSPSLIILDVEMPGLDGFETCRQLRARVRSKHLPVAFYTAHRRDSDVRLGLAVGGNDFLLKPIDPEKLISRVNRLMQVPPKAQQPAKAQPPPPGSVLWV